LHELIEDENPHVRLEALRALDSRGEISAGVKACLKDENTGVRLAAAKALAKHYGRDAIDALVDFAFFADGTHRSQASRLLAGIAPEQAAGRFMSVLADESQKRMWLVAIEALGELAPHFDLEQEHAAA
jgi:HEAT repeat protein